MQSTFKSTECRYHPDQQIMGVCLAQKCDLPSRLVCFSCSIQEHNEHARNIVKLKDMQTKSVLEHTNWPQNDLAQDIKKYLQQVAYLSEGGEKSIDKLFDDITQSVLNELQKSKKLVKLTMQKYINLTGSSSAPTSQTSTEDAAKCDQLTQRLKEKIFQIFDISKISVLFNSLRNGQINENEFNSDVSEFTKTVSSQELLDPLAQMIESQSKYIKQVLDTDTIQERLKDIVKMVREIPQVVVTQSAIACPMKFIAETAHEKSIIIQKNGRYCKMPSSYQSVFSSVIFESGKWEFQIETISNLKNNCVLFGLIPDDTQQSVNSTYSSHVYHCFGNSCTGNTTVKGTTIESQYAVGQILKVFIDMENNQYQFGWKGGKSHHILSNYTLQGKQMRFFIDSYGLAGTEFQILQARRTVATNFSNGNNVSTSSQKEQSTAPQPNTGLFEDEVPLDGEGLFG